MAYFRRPKDHDHPYAQIANEVLEDPHLSLKAKGLLAYLLSRSDDWEIYQQQLEQIGTDGRHSIRTALTELREEGYLDRIQWRDDDGKFAGYEYIVYEEPRSPGLDEMIRTEDEMYTEGEGPESEGTEIGNPEIGGPETTNTDDNKTEGTKTEERGGGGAGAQAREASGAKAVMPAQLAAVYDTYEPLVNERLAEFAPSEADQLISRAWGQLAIGSATMNLVDEYPWPLFVTGVTITEHEADSPNARFLHTVLKRLDELLRDDTDYTQQPDEAESNFERLARIAADA